MIGTYEQATAALYGRINYEVVNTDKMSPIDFKLDRMRRLLAELDDPHLKIPVVHVAGTKGKGTVCTLVAEFLKAGGYKVGLYTSPHMYRFEERFVVNGEQPSEADVVALTQTVLDAADRLQAEDTSLAPTFFECVNAMAWVHFCNQNVDLAVLEVGLGGRLDSTNLCNPLVTAITSISFDHTRILGSTLAEIAGEKAGIIKADVPVICGVLNPEAQAVVRAKAEEAKAPLKQLGRDVLVQTDAAWSLAHREQQVSLNCDGETWKLRLPFPGAVYADNAAIAVACVHELASRGFPVPNSTIAAAARNIALPLRFEILDESPVLIADSAHNAASIRALINAVREHLPSQPVTVMLAVSSDKDHAAICRELKGVERVIVTRYVGTARAVAPEQLAETAREHFGGQVLLAENPAAALEMARSMVGNGDVILATGSLFFAAEIRKIVSESPACSVSQPA
ncbi:bifunctional folylpolyglutamate synthase/dihydrofolate synthase [Rubinisphaera sp. JC750]|uniref:bifunctional folylpolyglutamate synthase/dihydrofolate synthase n=1 Tax=Rubinisphaera sp. JC750 TaxID=2898658 RepID=UPI001F44F882|nr:folylpolyglutamate synthase/dihydrofolate synthase family protein [Rubinisphaera sp. JC750]